MHSRRCLRTRPHKEGTGGGQGDLRELSIYPARRARLTWETTSIIADCGGYLCEREREEREREREREGDRQISSRRLQIDAGERRPAADDE